MAYDFHGEASRLRFPDITLRGVTLNRATARVRLDAPMERPPLEQARRAYRETAFTTTLDPASPVIELGWPVAGPYVASPAGVYMDTYLGVAQKILDESHPRLWKTADALVKSRLLFRREINTDDYMLLAGDLEGVAGPTEVARLFTSLAQERWPAVGGFRAFLSNSGTESTEAGMKLAWIVKYRRFLERHGMETFRRLMRDLEIPEVDYFRGAKEPVFENYPFVIVACEGSFHGRTLGSLHATRSKAAHQYAYPKSGGIRHIAYNSSGAALESKIDPRPIGEILAAPGGVRAVLESGRVPADLFAGFMAEPLQGEGGYLPGEARFFQECQAVCRRHGGLLMLDEVQTFGRSGTLFLAEQLGIEPDVLWTAKAAVVGVTLARAEYERHLHAGWHSNTFGGGKIFDLSFGYAVAETLARERPSHFAGLSYFENCAVKGEQLARRIEEIAKRHPAMVLGQSGRGLLRGVTVRRRDELVAEGWKRGLKMLGCGRPGPESRIRLIFLADTLAREIDDFARVFEETVAAVEASKVAAFQTS